MVELLLWRWSTVIQATSNLIIAVFFVSLALSLRRRELHAWLVAWLLNLGALSVTIAFWLLQPQTRLGLVIAAGGYLFCKTLFVALLLVGIGRFRGWLPGMSTHAPLVVAVAIFAVVAAWVTRSVEQLGVIQESVIALGLGAGAAHLLRTGGGFGWVASGFAMRSALAVTSVISYGLAWIHGAPAPGSVLSLFMASHSSFDTGAEWVIALGCLLTAYRLIQHELTASNMELRAAQAQMHQLLHRDQLTGVFNRRALPTMLDEARRQGATVLFFDLDDFKQVNDVQGHQAGDACLARFARMLQASFRTGDRVIRYAGDEFIVVAQEMDAASIEARVRALREQLQHADPKAPPIRFSVGRATLPPDGDPDAALHQADQAMYDAKAAARICQAV